MIAPLIHSNGTNGGTLLAEYATAIIALDRALREMENISVNGRDYYPRDLADSMPNGSAFRTARREYLDRHFKLESVLSELREVYADIERQRDARGDTRRDRP